MSMDGLFGSKTGSIYDFYDDVASFPTTGSDNITYVAEDTGLLYLWDGTLYLQVGGSDTPIADNLTTDSASIALSARQGKYLEEHKINRVLSQVGKFGTFDADGNLTASSLSETSTELQSSKPIRASEFIANSGTFTLDGAVDIKSNSESIETVDNERNQKHIMIHEHYDDDGSTLPEYVDMDAKQTRSFQDNIGQESDSFNFTQQVLNISTRDGIEWIGMYLNPAEAGLSEIQFKFTNASGVQIVSPEAVTFTTADIGNDVEILFNNSMRLYNGEVVYFEYTGAKLNGSTASGSFIPKWSSIEQEYVEKALITKEYVDNELTDKLDSSDYTASDIKTKYESNADTNAYTDDEKEKLELVKIPACGAGYFSSDVETCIYSSSTFYKVNASFTVPTGGDECFEFNTTSKRWIYTDETSRNLSIFMTFSTEHNDDNTRDITYKVYKNGTALTFPPSFSEVEENDIMNMSLLAPIVSFSENDYIELYVKMDSGYNKVTTSNVNLLIR